MRQHTARLIKYEYPYWFLAFIQIFLLTNYHRQAFLAFGCILQTYQAQNVFMSNQFSFNITYRL